MTAIRSWLPVLVMTLCCGALQACSDEDEPAPEPSITSPTGSPFSATLEGPDVASPGDRVTVTITNTGRLPDRYRLVANPEGGATVTPVELSLSAGESAELAVEVAVAPVVIRAESLGGGGSGTAIAELSIGGQGGA